MATNLDDLLKQFLCERKYLLNLRPRTLERYETAWTAFRKFATHSVTDPTSLNRADVEQFIYALRERGVKPVTCNSRLQAVNAFCRWLHENGHTPTHIKLRPLKLQKRLVQTLELDAIRAIVAFKPPVAASVNKRHLDGPRKGRRTSRGGAFTPSRVHSSTPGVECRNSSMRACRILDFDDLLVTVIGKGTNNAAFRFRWNCDTSR